MKLKKLLILQTHPIQYYAPIYRALAQRDRIEVKVIYLTDAGAMTYHDPGFGQQIQWDIPLLEGYEYRVLQPGTEITHRGFWQRHDSDLVRVLAEEWPDWIFLYGYASRMNWSAWCWSHQNGIKLAYTSDSNGRDIFPNLKTRLKQLLLRPFFRQFDCFFSPSDANQKYLLYFGVDVTRIVFSPFAIDFNRFSDTHRFTITAQRIHHFIWAGKMIERKRPQDFIHALMLLHRRGLKKVRACIVGDGPMLNSLQGTADQCLPVGMLNWCGFVNQNQMPNILCQAQVLVFTSEKEPYGLIATEAAACGLALIVSENIGCVGSRSSAQPSVNTLSYPAGNVQALADCMEALLTNPNQLRAMQEASIAIAAEHDVSRAAAIIESVILEENADHA